MSNLKELPQNLRISTMTAVSKINSNINLKALYDNLNIDNYIRFIEYSVNPTKGFHHKIISEKRKKKKKVFFNQITILILIENDINNIKLFNNGSISMTGVKSEKNGKKAIEILFEKLKSSDEILENKEATITNFEIVLINSDYDIGYEIKRSELHQILVNNYKIFSSFEPCIYPGVNSKYFWNHSYKDNDFKGKCYCINKCLGNGSGNGDGCCKRVTISVFQSGSIIITGAKSIEQIIDSYNFINKVFEDNKDKLKKVNPYFLENYTTPKIQKNKKKIWINKNNIIY